MNFKKEFKKLNKDPEYLRNLIELEQDENRILQKELEETKGEHMDQLEKLQSENGLLKLQLEQATKDYFNADQRAHEREEQIFDLLRQVKKWKEHTDKLEKDLEDTLIHNGNLIEKYSRALYLGTHMHLLRDKNGAEYNANYKELLALKYPELTEQELTETRQIVTG